METYDITGLSEEAARQYIWDITVHYKALDQQIQTLEQDKVLWESRVQVAAQAMREDLRAAAQGEADKISQKVTALLGERENVRRGLEMMKEQLRHPAFATAEIRDRSDRLLLELETLAGKPLDQSSSPEPRREGGEAPADTTAVPPGPTMFPGQIEKEIHRLNADKELEELKKKLGY